MTDSVDACSCHQHWYNASPQAPSKRCRSVSHRKTFSTGTSCHAEEALYPLRTVLIYVYIPLRRLHCHSDKHLLVFVTVTASTPFWCKRKVSRVARLSIKCKNHIRIVGYCAHVTDFQHIVIAQYYVFVDIRIGSVTFWQHEVRHCFSSEVAAVNWRFFSYNVFVGRVQIAFRIVSPECASEKRKKSLRSC